MLNVKERIFNPHLSRWIPVDLALSRDHAGIVMGHVPKFGQIKRGEECNETIPFIKVDFTLDVIPPEPHPFSVSVGLNKIW